MTGDADVPDPPPRNARYTAGVFGGDDERDRTDRDPGGGDDPSAVTGGDDRESAGAARAPGAAGHDAAAGLGARGDTREDGDVGREGPDDDHGDRDRHADGDGDPDDEVRGPTRGEEDEQSRSVQVLDRLQRRRPPPKRTGVFLDPDELRDHVGGLLRVMLGGYQVDAWGNFTFVHDGARVYVTVQPSPVGPQIGVLSVTNLDVDLTPQLAGFLLTTNHHLGFGGFSYDAENEAVWLRHTLLGTTLDFPELQAAVAAVANTAAHFVEVIKQRFGGRTFDEAPQDVQDSTQPPVPGDPSAPRGSAGGYL